MNITELKKYIFENGLQSTIIKELGLPNIREDDKKIQCSNIDGDNPTGVRIDIWTHLMRGCIIELCIPI